MHYSYEIFKLWAVPCHIQILNLVGSRSMVPKLWRFNVERCVFPHNFQRPLAAKSYTSHPKKLGRRNNGKDLFYHHSMVGLGLRTQLRKDTLTFLFFLFVREPFEGDVCARGMAIKQFEFRHGFESLI